MLEEALAEIRSVPISKVKEELAQKYRDLRLSGPLEEMRPQGAEDTSKASMFAPAPWNAPAYQSPQNVAGIPEPKDAGIGASSLEKCVTEAMIFDKYDGSYTNGQMPSAYVLKYKGGRKVFFASNGRVLGIKDRFNNEIRFSYIFQI